MANKEYIHEKRQYIRLKSVFPVDFSVVSSAGNSWHQGYTANVSQGGICLETSDVDQETLEAIVHQKVLLDVHLHLPLSRPPIKAKAQVAWIQKTEDDTHLRFQIGLKFSEIAAKDVHRIVGYARWLRFSFQSAVMLAAVLLLAFSVSLFHNYKLRSANQVLVHQLVSLEEQYSQENQSLKKVTQQKKALKDKIDKSVENALDRQTLETQYGTLLDEERQITDRVAILTRQKEGLQAKVLSKMYLWLKNHQSPSTGLIQSFEGEVKIVKDWAFTYDEALGVNVFLLFHDEKAARDILNFYSRTLSGPFQGFTNGYYYDSGQIAEFTVHCGPNIWLGLAILQYTSQTGDSTYLPMAEKIADWLISLQDQDPAGGLRGGPTVTWFATEHNLDAYAFFHMLEQVTHNAKYTLAQQKIFSWLQKYAMVAHPKDYQSPPMNRGRGDSTVATDTFAWSLAALGPKTLSENGMDPEQIMEFAKEHCGVKISFKRPSGIIVDAEGFDFSKSINIARGGLISPEWTSQMIVSYQMLSDYFKDINAIKTGYYKQEADKYLNELNKLIISSPSPRGQGEGCLPYATLEDVDTGHGWRTPHGTSTCSIAGTAYMIMAIKEYNPLMLKGGQNK
ncbi:MAG: PilZ domain-containing protein [Candidatus Omnitrophica bacterium]|nr:PilZ domain-containing protein [Candidatus Omnitrophota bacterium]